MKKSVFGGNSSICKPLLQKNRSIPVLLVLLLAASTVVAQPSPGRPTPKEISSRIEALVSPSEKAKALSGSILVASGNQILFEKSYGFSNWEAGVPNTSTTRFGIASITKHMTEILIDQLAQSGIPRSTGSNLK